LFWRTGTRSTSSCIHILDLFSFNYMMILGDNFNRHYDLSSLCYDNECSLRIVVVRVLNQLADGKEARLPIVGSFSTVQRI